MDLLNENNSPSQKEQIEMLKKSHLFELTRVLVTDDTYGEYLIKNSILHEKTLPVIEYGISYYADIEKYEECAMLVTLKKEILKQEN